MSGRYTSRNRYGENLGSIKSRIQAREGSGQKDDASKLKEARLRTEARLFQRSEGVRSRMNKFGGQASPSPGSAESPVSTGKKGEKTVPSRVANGNTDEVSKTSRLAVGGDKDDKSSLIVSNQTTDEVNTAVEAKSDVIQENGDSSAALAQSSSLNNESDDNSSEKNEIPEDCFSSKNKENGSVPNGSDDEVTNDVITASNESPSVSDDVTDPDLASAPKETKSSSSTIDEVTNGEVSSSCAMQSEEDADRSTPTESNPVSARQRRRLQLDDLDQDDCSSTRRRRRGRRGQDSARSSEASSLVSTPDRDSLAPQAEITPKTGSPTSDTPEPDPVSETIETVPEVEEAITNESPLQVESETPIENVVPDEVETSRTDIVEENAITEVTEEKEKVQNEKVTDNLVEKSQAQGEATEPGPVPNDKEDKTTAKTEAPTEESPSKAPQYTMDNIEECTDLTYLDKLLFEVEGYEDRKRIRSVMRALKKSGIKPAQKSSYTPSKSTSSYQSRNSKTSATSTGNERATSRVANKQAAANTKPKKTPTSGLTSRLGDKENKSPPDPKLLAEKYGLSSLDKKDSSGKKKVGSIFDREEESPKKSSRQLELERRQAERKREMMRRAPAPSASSKDARKKFVAQLEVDGGQGKSMKSPSSIVPNANNVKNKLLRWCQVKTRAYENVDITNYSTSWANGMAFCALTHNFFPDAFDFSELNPTDREKNFNLAFTTAEERGEIPILLDVVDLVRMDEPDWKCIYTYLTEFYKHLYEKGMT